MACSTSPNAVNFGFEVARVVPEVQAVTEVLGGSGLKGRHLLKKQRDDPCL